MRGLLAIDELISRGFSRMNANEGSQDSCGASCFIQILS